MVGPKILAAAWTPDESSLIVSGYLEGANQAIDNVMVPAGDEVFWFELSGATGAAAHGGAVGPPLAGGVYQDLVVDDDAAVFAAGTSMFAVSGWNDILWDLDTSGPTLSFQRVARRAGRYAACGTLSDVATVGGKTLQSKGKTDTFVVMGSSETGAVDWAASIASELEETLCSVAIDAHGDVVVSTFLTGTTGYIGDDEVPLSTGDDVAVVKFTAAGALRAYRVIAESGLQTAFDAAVHSDGAVTIVGGMAAPADFGGGTLGVAGGFDAFAVTYGP